MARRQSTWLRKYRRGHARPDSETGKDGRRERERRGGGGREREREGDPNGAIEIVPAAERAGSPRMATEAQRHVLTVGAGDLGFEEPDALLDQTRETGPEVDVRDPLAALEVLDLPVEDEPAREVHGRPDEHDEDEDDAALAALLDDLAATRGRGTSARCVDVDLVERGLVAVADGGECTLGGGTGDLDVPERPDSDTTQHRIASTDQHPMTMTTTYSCNGRAQHTARAGW